MEDLNKVRKYQVVKSNTLIQKTRYDLNLKEQKIILRLIQMIKPEDRELGTYTFDIIEFCKLVGINPRSGQNFNDVKAAIKGLADKSFWVDKGDGTSTLCRWIDKPTLHEHGGVATIRLDDDLKPYLLELKDYFTSYSFENIAYMKSKYSVRLYELMKSYENTKIVSFTPEQIKDHLAIEADYSWYDIKRRVLEIAIKEINEKTDIHVVMGVNMEKRKVLDVKFYITKNKRDPLATLQLPF